MYDTWSCLEKSYFCHLENYDIIINQLFKKLKCHYTTGAVGGDGETEDDKEKAEEEERERQEAIREAEERRKEKHRKMEEEREKMRQEIRDKVSIWAIQNFRNNINYRSF